MKASISDVAKLAGVAKSTVSRVLNGGYASKATIEKVNRAIEELDFTPNAIARGLAINTSHTIGFLYYSFNDYSLFNRSSQFELLRGVEEVIDNRGYNLLLMNGKDYNCSDYIEVLKQKRIDGLIVGGVRKLKGLEQALKLNPNIVYIGDKISSSYGCNITLHHDIKTKALDYLIQKGHRRIGIIKTIEDDKQLYSYQQLYDNYAKEHHVKIHYINMTFEERNDLHTSMEHILKDCTAIYLSENIYAEIVIHYMRDKGIRISEDISLIYESITDSEDDYLYANYTSLYMPLREIGHSAAELVLNGIEKQETGKEIIATDSKIIERGTVKHIES